VADHLAPLALMMSTVTKNQESAPVFTPFSPSVPELPSA
jgi:hypothetical protein